MTTAVINTLAEHSEQHPGYTPMMDFHPRRPIVRQDRVEVAEEECTIVIGDRAYRVLDYSPFGIAVQCERPFKQGSEFLDAPLSVNGVVIAALNLKTVREEVLPGLGFKIGMTITGEPLSMEKIRGIRCAEDLIARFHQDARVRADIPQAFRQQTLEIKDILEHAEHKVNELEAQFRAENIYSEDIDALEAAVVPVIGEFLQQTLDPQVQKLAASLAGVDDSKVKPAYEFFRAKLGTLIYQSPFSKRSYAKPLGYAGDYEMMNMIYRNDRLGSSLFARCLHNYIVNMPGGKAVRNRAVYLNTKLSRLLRFRHPSRFVKVLSVASGPAMEVQMLLTQQPAASTLNAEFHLLDQDVHSLKFAQRKIKELVRESGRPCELKLFQKTIKHLITEGVEEDEYDMIYTAGLFDYFSDPVAQMAARRLYNMLNPGGQLIIGNFNVTSPSRFFMELAWDWNLVYRSEDDLKRLFRNLDPNITVEREEQGVNLFCVITREAN